MKRPQVADPRLSARRIRTPADACAPADLHWRCRDGAPVGVEESTDGGRTFRPLWKLPRAAVRYIQTHRDQEHALGIGVYALAFDPSGERLVIALGSEGVIVLDRKGTLSRQVVGAARPRIPFSPLKVISSLARALMSFSSIPAYLGFVVFSPRAVYVELWPA